nr:MAG TPA: hypothetical protein [Caudoviricetes sp.]
MNKDVLEQINSIRRELKDLNSRIIVLNQQTNPVVVDSVQGSSATYPYIQHNCKIEGSVESFKNKNIRKKYKKQIKSKEYKLDKLKNQLEYELNYVEDSEIRRILRYKYEDDLNWVQIMHKMEYNSEYKARKKIERFFEKK